MECWMLIPKNSVKFKQYYYFHAEFLEEVRYKKFKTESGHTGQRARCILSGFNFSNGLE